MTLPTVVAELNLTPAGVRIGYYRNDGRTIGLDYGATPPSNAASRVWAGQIRRTTDDGDPVLGTLTGTVDDTDPDHYMVNFTPDDDAVALADGDYVYDLQYTVGDGRPRTVLAGPWVMLGDVTR